MGVLHANPGPFSYRGPEGRYGSFRPSGSRIRVGRVYQPNSWFSEKPVLAARILVGFNVGEKPTWTLEDVVAIVKSVRTEESKPDASFVAQRGFYRHKVTNKLVEEDGAQVIIVDILGMSYREFVLEMVWLAKIIARELRQEEVIVDIQKDGVTQKVIGADASEEDIESLVDKAMEGKFE